MSDDDDDAMLMATSFSFIKRKRRSSDDEDGLEGVQAMSFADLVKGNQEKEALLASDGFWERMIESSQEVNDPVNELELNDENYDAPLYFHYFKTFASDSKEDGDSGISDDLHNYIPSGLDSHSTVLMGPLLAFMRLSDNDFEVQVFTLLDSVLKTSNALLLQEIVRSCCQVIDLSGSCCFLINSCLEKALLNMTQFDILGAKPSNILDNSSHLQFNALTKIILHCFRLEKVTVSTSVRLLSSLIPLLFEENFRSHSIMICELIFAAFESIGPGSQDLFSDQLLEFMSNPIRRSCDVIRMASRTSSGEAFCSELIQMFNKNELQSEHCQLDFNNITTTFVEAFGFYVESSQNMQERNLKKLRHLTSLAFVWIINTPLQAFEIKDLSKFQSLIAQLRDSIPSIPDYFNMKILEDIGKIHTFIETYLRIKESAKRKATITSKR